MGITTRGGEARVLEYNKNEDLISKAESHKRIHLLLIILTIFLNSTLFILILLVTISVDLEVKLPLKNDELNPRVARLPNYILSVSNDNDIFLNQLIVSKNHTFKMLSTMDREPLIKLLNFNYTLPYEFNGELYFLYGKINREFGLFKKVSDLKISTKYYNKRYLLQNEPSLIRVGSKILLYGKKVLLMIFYPNFQICISNRCWCN